MTADIVKIASSRERTLEYTFEGDDWLIRIEASSHEVAKRRISQIAAAWAPPRRSLARWIFDTFIRMEDGK